MGNSFLELLDEKFQHTDVIVKRDTRSYFEEFVLIHASSSSELKGNLIVDGYQHTAQLELISHSGDEQIISTWLSVMVESAEEVCKPDADIYSLIISKQDSPVLERAIRQSGFTWLDSNGLLDFLYVDGQFFKPLTEIGERQKRFILSYIEAVDRLKTADPVFFQNVDYYDKDEFIIDAVFQNVSFEIRFSFTKDGVQDSGIEMCETQKMQTENFINTFYKKYDTEKVRQALHENTPYFDLYFERVDDSKPALDSIRTELIQRYSREKLENFYMVNAPKVTTTHIHNTYFHLFPALESFVLVTFRYGNDDENDCSFSYSFYDDYEEAVEKSKQLMNETYSSYTAKLYLH